MKSAEAVNHLKNAFVVVQSFGTCKSAAISFRIIWQKAVLHSSSFILDEEHEVTDDLQDQFRQLDPMERTLVVRFATAIHVLLELYHRLTIAQATTFLAVWAEEGLNVSTLALRCGVEPSTISHHLRVLTSRHVRGSDGLGLLIVKDERTQRDLRHRYVFLTERGAALAARMVELLDADRRRRIPPMGILDLPE
ncbi:hypothetical protein QA633_41070 [Bradyrhizobium barranii]|uniref:hypothetical protein n=1 Tax=Bradyrhizobium barranii TaxID=2992140 RepID=UPI0024AEC2B9|nr:hypothetical protein [Bradyrhizobium barranii]WFT94577.1 hypothetical protein QA633_41070 [Bradyrhizobium barranii]